MPQCHSTNEVLASFAKNKELQHGTCLIADKQTQGKGQQGTHWYSEAHKNITLSYWFQMNLPLGDTFIWSQAIALAVRDTIDYFLHKETGLAWEVKVKWPNDIYINDRKVSGILIENRVSGQSITESIVGIGLNVNQKVFYIDRASSLAAFLDKEILLTEVVEELHKNVELAFLKLQNAHEKIKSEYLKQLYGRGKNCQFQLEDGTIVSGIPLEVDDEGKLGIFIDNNLCFFRLKEIKLLIP